MTTTYQARWLSKQRRDELKRRVGLRDVVLLDCLHGFIIVEPSSSQLGDGELLTMEDADQELRTAWCLDRTSKLVQARQFLGLPAEEAHTFPAISR